MILTGADLIIHAGAIGVLWMPDKLSRVNRITPGYR